MKKDYFWYLVATVFGLGNNAPVAPGTVMSGMVTVWHVAWLWAQYLGEARIFPNIWLNIGLIGVSWVLGYVSVRPAARYLKRQIGKASRYDNKDTDLDYQEIVIDEVLGQAIAGMPLFLFVFPSFGTAALYAAISLGLFRLFDIKKWWPVGLFDRRDTPGGVMNDDVAAGLVAAILLSVVCLIQQYPFLG